MFAFFYCDFRNERSTSAAEVMRSILSQLLCQLRGGGLDVGGLINDMVTAKERGGATGRSARQLARYVSATAGLWSQKPLVVVDALDECKSVQDLLQALVMIRGRVRLFVTGRPLHTIVSELSGVPFLSMDDMADKLSTDIELHVTRELDARQRLRDLDAGFKEQIRSALCSKADGM